MNLFGFWRHRVAEAPSEVIRAACDLYGVSTEHPRVVKAEKLKALSDNVWVVQVNEKESAVVAYTPGEQERVTSAPWYEE
jgi:hypothetical protein